jgi:rfaE bifunctional protein kinase chain/domain
MIAVIGEILIDRYIFGDCHRLSPEAPVPIVKHTHTEDRAGGAENVYQNIKALTDDVVFSVKCENPPIKMRIFSQNHYMSRVDFEGNFHKWEILDNYQDADIVVVSDYDKNLFNYLTDIPNLPKKTIVDTKKSLDHYRGAWCLKPNRLEYERHVGKWLSIDELYTFMAKTIRNLELEHLIVTLGAEGCAYRNKDGAAHYFHPAPVEVCDPTGCGDSFVAALAYALHRGDSFVEAIELANAAGAVAVSHIGTYVVTKSDIL